MYSWALATGERVKKCASCSKDLPEAALHCVFCGAKQALAPAAAPAKTAFGYSANEVMQQLGNAQPPRAHRPSNPNYGSPTAPSHPGAATVVVPTSGGSAGNFNAQPAYAATDYAAPQSPAYASTAHG